MTALPHAPRLTPEEYLAIERAAEEKSEFFDGVMHAMSGGSLSHSRIATNLLYRLSAAFEGRQCEAFNSDLRVQLGASGDYAYPDVSALCGQPVLADDDVLTNPSLIVEVLSPTTRRYDQERKFLHYQAIESFTEYVLIEQDHPFIRSYSRRPDGVWTVQFFDGLDAALDLRSVGVSIPLREIYDKVEFPTPAAPASKAGA
jgi:Uma2 family endonuclease